MNERPCVRCGERPRHDDSFICAKCAGSAQTKREIAAAKRASSERDYLLQRKYLTDRKGWVGGWSIRRGSVRA
jgi:ribosomal protein L37E